MSDEQANELLASLLADTSIETIQMIIDEAAATGCHPSVLLDLAVARFCGRQMGSGPSARDIIPVGFHLHMKW